MNFNTDKGAIFSEDKKYRYVLWRNWDINLPKIMFIGLNPSTADENIDDPTIRRCIGFTKDWGYGGFFICNLFGYRTPFPKDLKKEQHPIGDNNDKWISDISNKVDKVVFIWGTNGTYLNRNILISSQYNESYCIEKSKNGHPKHPLYLKKDLILIKY